MVQWDSLVGSSAVVPGSVIMQPSIGEIQEIQIYSVTVGKKLSPSQNVKLSYPSEYERKEKKNRTTVEKIMWLSKRESCCFVAFILGELNCARERLHENWNSPSRRKIKEAAANAFSRPSNRNGGIGWLSRSQYRSKHNPREAWLMGRRTALVGVLSFDPFSFQMTALEIIKNENNDVEKDKEMIQKLLGKHYFLRTMLIKNQFGRSV